MTDKAEIVEHDTPTYDALETEYENIWEEVRDGVEFIRDTDARAVSIFYAKTGATYDRSLKDFYIRNPDQFFIWKMSQE